jgi:hypothetical protein
MTRPRPLARLALLLALVLTSSPALSEDDQPSDELKNPFPSTPSKKPEKPVAPCASTCQDVRVKKRACDKASSACDSAYKEAKRNCKKACDEAARTAPCGGDPDCLRIVDEQNKSCCSECDRTSYDLAACSEKDSLCSSYVSARDSTECRC